MRLATEKDLIGGQGLATIGPQINNDKYSEVKQYKYMNGALPGAGQAQPAPAFNSGQQQAQPPAQQTMPFGQTQGQPANAPPPFGGQQPAAGGFQPQGQQGGFQQAPPQPGLPPWAK